MTIKKWQPGMNKAIVISSSAINTEMLCGVREVKLSPLRSFKVGTARKKIVYKNFHEPNKSVLEIQSL